MTDQPDNQSDTDPPDHQGGTVTLGGTSYVISPTAFRAHYQVMTSDGKLMGLIEFSETPAGRKFTARPASGAGMTLSLMLKIAEEAASAGVIK